MHSVLLYLFIDALLKCCKKETFSRKSFSMHLFLCAGLSILCCFHAKPRPFIWNSSCSSLFTQLHNQTKKEFHTKSEIIIFCLFVPDYFDLILFLAMHWGETRPWQAFPPIASWRDVWPCGCLSCMYTEELCIVWADKAGVMAVHMGITAFLDTASLLTHDS